MNAMRVKLLVAAGVAALLSSAAGAAPARAAGTCTVQAPTKVRVTAATTPVTLRLLSDCAAAGATEAGWYVFANGYDQAGFDFLPETSVVWRVGANHYIVPTIYTWSAVGAHTSTGATVAQNTPAPTELRNGTGAVLYASRSGSEVRLTTSSSRYDMYQEKWVRWAGVRGTIQYWGPTGWTNMKYTYQDSNGYYTYRFHPATARSYRVVFPDVADVWGSVSNTRYL